MARLARCPSCGAPVEFKSVASVLAVCDYCQSTLLQDGAALQNLGKMAALVEDRSPLQRGAEGRWQGRQFGLIGRIQLNWDQGLWNEWHILFDDMKSGWLSEANGEYVVSEAKRVSEALPAFDQLELGRLYMIDGRAFTLTNLLTATCVSGEGELPFKVGAGYPAPVADLRDDQGAFATLDYSDDPAKPLVFIGEPVAFKSLAWANLRDLSALPQPTLKARSFACPTCGAPLQVTHEKIETVGCGSCGAVLDTRNEKVAQIAQAQRQLLAAPLIPLGTKGSLQGEAVEVIGYMSRSTESDGVHYYWREYVLAAPEGRFVWLTEYDGHWNVARVLSRTLRAGAGQVRLDGEDFKHFSSYQASVDYVIGEFPWRVTLDETATVHDYVLPPRMLSQEVTPNEQTWSLCDYIEPGEIVAAFGLKTALPPPRGVYANQINPHEENHRRTCSRFWKFSLAATAIYILLLIIGPGANLTTQPVSYGPNDDDEPKLTREIPLPRGARRLEISHSTNLTNNWVGLNMTLVNKDTGDAWQAYREISRYEGVDGGESWSEGSRDDEVIFTDLPPGTYVLAEEPEMDPLAPRVGAEIKIATAGPRWSSLLLVVIFLMLFPIWTRMRKGGFEVRRWAESDHPIVTSSEDDE